MCIFQYRESSHASAKRAAAALLPLAFLLGCNSAPTGHAPGLAGGQSLTPGISNYPMVYVKQPVLAANTNKQNQSATPTDIDVRDLITSITGSDLYARDTASAGSPETNVTASITMGHGAVRDLDVSPDGTKVVFALRLPLNPQLKNDDPKQPNWKIYQYDAKAKTVTQLTTDTVTSGHDVGPHFLPDGRIIFSSSRQVATQAILLDEGRPQYQAVTTDQKQPIFLLHVMNADGSGMHQVSFNTNHDFAPSVLANGQIVFSRWDTENGGEISLYVTNPDGTGLQLLYGANSHATGTNIAGTNNNVIQFLNARQRSDGTLLAITRPFLGTQLGGDIVDINNDNFVEINQPSSPTSTLKGPAQTSATVLGVTTAANMPSGGGRFYSMYPLYDGTNRMLVSWSPCLIENIDGTTSVCNNTNTTGPNVKLAPPQYTVWVYDFDAGTLSPLLSAEAGMEIVEPIILQARTPTPTFIPDFKPTTPAEETLVNNQVGILDIASVYDYDGVDTAKPSIAAQADPANAGFYSRPARFVRIEKAVEIPPKTVRKINQSAFGPTGAGGMGMREILGYAPVQPDGSVQIQVPANVPFVIDVLDANARRITAQHTSWMQVMPGEIKSCNGCHTAGNLTQPSHGRGGLTVAVNKGAATTGAPFPNTYSALFANRGETMAQTLARISCEQGSALGKLAEPNTQPCSQILASDVIYAPIWTQGVTTPQADNYIDLPYGTSVTNAANLGIPSTPPTNNNCVPWSAQCRITIHYANANSNPTQLFIQNLWNSTTRVATVNGVANTSVTCTNCHNTLNLQNKPQVPAGQLDLTGGTSGPNVVTPDATLVTSYQNVLSQHFELTLNMGVLQELTVTNPGPPPSQQPVMLPAPMVAGDAAASTAFFRMFDANGFADPVLDHRGFMTIGELRLVSEWLDIGGQFYNDPFVAPAAAN
jgi:Hydrazine synthase alpha subunit middle domain/WD40-like Beta Propeller Repeat